jgi:hypothetical protein
VLTLLSRVPQGRGELTGYTSRLSLGYCTTVNSNHDSADDDDDDDDFN